MITVCVLTQIPNGSRDDSQCGVTAGGLRDKANSGGTEIELGCNKISDDWSFIGMFTVGRALGESVDDTEKVAAAATQTQVHAAGIAGLSHVELMAEANQIMKGLYRDGVLTQPSSYACAFADTSPGNRTTKTILEQFRRMHQLHLALVKSLLTSGDQDSLATRGWSKIRIDLAKLRTMASEVRNDNALVTR